VCGVCMVGESAPDATPFMTERMNRGGGGRWVCILKEVFRGKGRKKLIPERETKCRACAVLLKKQEGGGKKEEGRGPLLRG